MELSLGDTYYLNANSKARNIILEEVLDFISTWIMLHDDDSCQKDMPENDNFEIVGLANTISGWRCECA